MPALVNRSLSRPLSATCLGRQVFPDLYLTNVYRLAGRPSGAPWQRIPSMVDPLVGRLKITASRVLRSGTDLGYLLDVPPARFGEELAAARRDPRALLVSDVFWPSLDPMPARLADLDARGRTDLAARHAHAIVLHNRAIAAELNGGVSLDEVDREWINALAAWKTVLDAPEFCAFLESRVETLHHISLNGESASALRRDLPAVLLSLHQAFFQHHLASGDRAGASRHARIVRESGFDENLTRPVLGAMSRLLVNQSLGNSSESFRRELDARQGFIALGDFVEIVEPVLEALESAARSIRADLAMASGSDEQRGGFDTLCRTLFSAVNARLEYGNSIDREKRLFYGGFVFACLLRLPLGIDLHRDVVRELAKHADGLWDLKTSDEDELGRLFMCWFFPLKRPSPDDSLLVAHYRVVEETRTNIRYARHNFLVPRSSLAARHHVRPLTPEEMNREVPDLAARVARVDREERTRLASAARKLQTRKEQLDAALADAEEAARSIQGQLDASIGPQKKELARAKSLCDARMRQAQADLERDSRSALEIRDRRLAEIAARPFWRRVLHSGSIRKERLEIKSGANAGLSKAKGRCNERERAAEKDHEEATRTVVEQIRIAEERMRLPETKERLSAARAAVRDLQSGYEKEVEEIRSTYAKRRDGLRDSVLPKDAWTRTDVYRKYLDQGWKKGAEPPGPSPGVTAEWQRKAQTALMRMSDFDRMKMASLMSVNPEKGVRVLDLMIENPWLSFDRAHLMA